VVINIGLFNIHTSCTIFNGSVSILFCGFAVYGKVPENVDD